MISDAARQEAFELRECLRPVTTVLSVSNCPYGYRRTENGLEESGCWHSHSCPVCTRKLQALKRERFISEGEKLADLGFDAWHLSLTVSHLANAPSERYSNLLKGVWRKFNTSQTFKAVRMSEQFGGYVRILEETISLDARINPHIHLVIFWRGEWSGLLGLIPTWVVSAMRIPAVTAQQSSQTLEPVRNLKGLAWYLFKHMYIDVNKPRKALGAVNYPIDVLRDYLATRSLDALALWFVFETSVSGWKRSMFRIAGHVS